ncbi:MAG: beta-N-acetylhexosaminidase, partial [Verrucomicrobiota bacterium]
MKRIIAAITWLFPLALLAVAPAIIPRPVSMEVRPGSYALTKNSRVIVGDGAGELSFTADYLAARLAPALGVRPEILRQRGSRGIRLSLLQTPEAALGEEGYRLTVSGRGIEIAANRPAGCFYGVQTLLQLLPPEIEAGAPSAKSTWQVPCVVVEDHPRYHWRGLLLDVSRHFFSAAEVKAYLDQMARYK